MKDRKNLESLCEFLKFAQKEIKLALDGKQTLSNTARSLSITPQRMNSIKTAPRYFDNLIKDHFVSIEDFAEILRSNQLMEEQLFKFAFDVNNDKIVSLSEEEIKIIDKIIDEALSDRQKDVILKRFADGMTLEEVGETLDVSRERIRQIEAKAIRILKHRIYESFKKTYIKDDLSTEDVIDAVKDNDIKTTFYESIIQETLKTDKLINLDNNQENIFKDYFKNELKIDPSYSSKKELVDLLQENNQIFYELMMRLYPDININIDTTINDSRMKLTPIDSLGLSSRTKNILRRLHVEVLEDLQHYRVWDLILVRNLGQKSLDELKKVMEEHSLEFKE